jgi:hypothetical protein
MGKLLSHREDRTLTASINDHTVPYPSSAIETVDHFADWDERDLRVEADEADLIVSWSAPPPEDVKAKKKKGWGISVGTLPPVLRYRFPFNYVSVGVLRWQSLTSDHSDPLPDHVAPGRPAHVS